MKRWKIPELTLGGRRNSLRQEAEPGSPDPEDGCSGAMKQSGTLSQRDQTGRGAQLRVLLWRVELGSAWRLLLALLLMWHLGELQLQGLECSFRTRVAVAPVGKGHERGLVDH